MPDPGDMLFDPEAAIECGLMMTDQDIQDLAEWNRAYRREKEEPHRIAGRYTGEAEVSGYTFPWHVEEKPAE